MKQPWIKLPTPNTAGMTHPVRHLRCGKVHDAGKVKVIYRHTDCTGWECPGCGGTCDDRFRSGPNGIEPL